MALRIASDWPRAESDLDVRNATRDLLANHTLIVGQSRSGKSTAARRLIEEIILETSGRVVVLDPNADFVEIDQIGRVPPADTTFEKRWIDARAQMTVISPRRQSARRGLAWSKLTSDEREAVLGLSPEATPMEYVEYRRHSRYLDEKGLVIASLPEFKASLEDYSNESTSMDRERIERYRAWLERAASRAAWVHDGLDEILSDEGKRLIVVDVSTRESSVKYMTAARVLEQLWSAGEARRDEEQNASGNTGRPWVGTIVVIDEAHLFAPFELPEPGLQRFLSERIERFSDQGKKFNLFLVLITQQPGKLNPRVLAECNNRVVLRMNEQLSLRVLEATYGGEPGRYDGSLTFPPNRGYALIEGALLSDTKPPDPDPRAVRFEQGRTKEGGGGTNTDWTLKP